MDSEDRDFVRLLVGDTPAMTPSQWVEGNVYLPRKIYPTSMPGAFTFERQPWLREVVDSVAERGKLETVIWKCSQCGVTESVLQNVLRWQLCNRPLPIMWLAGQEEFLEGFWADRILPGIARCLSPAAVAALGGWKCVGVGFTAGNGASLAGVWATNKSGLKGKSYGLVLCDEVSTYQSFAMEKVRPRVANFPDGKIYAVSALDCRGRLRATKDDPLFLEWESTDRREWVMPDPVTGREFTFNFGWKSDGEEDGHKAGVRWSPEARKDNGDWDMQMVADTAHFETEDGTVISEAERFRVVSKGRWKATADGRPGARGYRIPAMLCANHSFAELAVGFLRAKRAGAEQLRTFVCELLAEEWVENRIVIGESVIDSRRAEYRSGQRLTEATGTKAPYAGKQSRVLCSGDVQKFSLYWLAREWVLDKSGRADSGLVAWEEVQEWERFEELTRQVKAFASMVDLRYKWRRSEVLEYASAYPYIIPCVGSDSRMKNILRLSTVDAMEGKEGGGRRRNGIGVITFDSWVFSYHLFGLMQGRSYLPKWYVPMDTDREYVRQLMAEEFRDGKVVERHAGAANHLLDCEKLQVVGAIFMRFLSPFKASFTLPDNLAVPREA